MSWQAAQLITSIPRIVNSHSAVRLLTRLTDIYKKEGIDAEITDGPHIAIAGCYAKLGLWKEAKRCAEHFRSSHRAAVLSHIGYHLDRKGRLAEARQVFIEALKMYGDIDLSKALSQMCASYSISWAKVGKFRQALETLQNVREPSSISRALIEICRVGHPSVKESMNFVTERGLIENISGTFVDQCDLVQALTAKAHFARKAGCEKEADENIQRTLNMVANQCHEGGAHAGEKLAKAAKGLSGLLVRGSNQQLLQDWLRILDIIVRTTDDPLLVGDIVGALAPNIMEDNPWLVSKVINIIRRNGFRTSKSARYLGKLAELVSCIQSEKLCCEYWEQFIRAFAELDRSSVKAVVPALCGSLARSSMGGEKKRFLRELCVAAVAKDRSRIHDTFRGDTLREVICAFVKSEDFQDKKAILREMLVDGWFSRVGFAVFDAVIAEGFALLGDKEEAKSLFEKAMDYAAHFSPESSRVIAESDVLSLMVACGFKKDTLPALKILGESRNYLSDLVKKNTAISLLCCDEWEAASNMVCGITEEFIRVATLMELCECTVRKLGHMVDENLETIKAHGGKKIKNRKAVLHTMEKYIAMVDETRDVRTRNDALWILASTLCLLPTEQAQRWLAGLPHFTDEHKVWEKLCTTNNYSPEVIKKVLNMIPHPESKLLLVRSLSNLSDDTITNKLRLLLCAEAVTDENCFFEVVCDTLENCTDPTTLEEVRWEIDEIEGTKTKVAKTKDKEPEPVQQGKPKPLSPLPSVGKKEYERIEVEFTSTHVKINNKEPPKQLTVEWRMLEYFLWKNDRVHWTEGYLIFPGWSKLPDGASDGPKQFGAQATTKCRQNAEKNGLKIEFKKSKYADADWWKLVTHNISTNITKAALSYKEAEDFFDAGNWNEAWDNLLETLEIYPNYLESYLLLVRCYDKLSPEKRADIGLQQLQSFWRYLDNKRIIIDGIKRICSKKKKDKELHVFLLSLINRPPYSQLDEFTELLWSWIVKMNLTDNEIEITKINRLLRDIRTAENNSPQQEEKINAFCQTPCVAEILRDEKFVKASGLLFFSRESNDIIESRFKSIVTGSYETVKHLQGHLRKTLGYLNKDLKKQERPGEFVQFGEYKKYDRDIKKIEEIKEKLCQEQHRDRIPDEDIMEAAKEQTDWSEKYIKFLIVNFRTFGKHLSCGS